MVGNKSPEASLAAKNSLQERLLSSIWLYDNQNYYLFEPDNYYRVLNTQNPGYDGYYYIDIQSASISLCPINYSYSPINDNPKIQQIRVLDDGSLLIDNKPLVELATHPLKRSLDSNQPSDTGVSSSRPVQEHDYEICAGNHMPYYGYVKLEGFQVTETDVLNSGDRNTVSQKIVHNFNSEDEAELYYHKFLFESGSYALDPYIPPVYLVIIENESQRFYEVTLHKFTVTIRHGIVGTIGEISSMTYISPPQAKIAANQEIEEKLRQGYFQHPSPIPKKKQDVKLTTEDSAKSQPEARQGSSPFEVINNSTPQGLTNKSEKEAYLLEKDIFQKINNSFVEVFGGGTGIRFRVRNLKLNGGENILTLDQGGLVKATLEINHDCSECQIGAINQIIVGLAGEKQAQACVWIGGRSSNGWQTVSCSLNIPNVPNVYYVRTRYAQAYNGQDALKWWHVERSNGPTEEANIGAVVVQGIRPFTEKQNGDYLASKLRIEPNWTNSTEVQSWLSNLYGLLLFLMWLAIPSLPFLLLAIPFVGFTWNLFLIPISAIFGAISGAKFYEFKTKLEDRLTGIEPAAGSMGGPLGRAIMTLILMLLFYLVGAGLATLWLIICHNLK